MDGIASALVGGLLGAVSGAVIGGAVALWQQRRAFDHERTTRFLDLKRQRYADLLRLTDERVRQLGEQRETALHVAAAGQALSGVPASTPTSDIEQLAEEIELLASKAVSGPAMRLAVAVRDMVMTYQFRPDRPVTDMFDQDSGHNGARLERRDARAAFVAAAKADLGT